MKILDATPQIEDFGDGDVYASISVEFSYDGASIEDAQSLNGDFISSTDWDGVREDFEDEVAILESESFFDAVIDYSIIDTSSEFGFKVEYELSFTESTGNFTYSGHFEIRHDKETGVLNFLELRLSSFLDNTAADQEITKIHRLGVDNGGGVPLPGFELFFTFMSLSTIAIIIKRH